MKLGFFGGSFNPPTIAHYNLIKQALVDYNFDDVYFVPVNNFYLKKDLIDVKNRIEMLELLIKNDEHIHVSKIEVENNVPLNAIDIFELINKKYCNDEIVFFMGEDNFYKMYKWKDFEKLKKYKYLIFQRNSKYDANITKNNIIYMKNNENSNVSSTLIRNRIRNNESIDDLVISEIKEYIISNKLYI